MARVSMSRISEWSVLALLVVSVLWRGGKGLELTWLTALVAGVITLMYGLKRVLRISTTEPNIAENSFRNFEVPSVLFGMIIAFNILTIFSYVHSSAGNYGLDMVLQTISFSLIFLWVVQAGLSTKQGAFFSRVIHVISWTAVTATFIGVLVYVFQPVNRFTGTFFDVRFNTDYWPNAWAEFILIAWPILLIQWNRSKDIHIRKLLAGSLGIVLGALLLSYSRGAMLAFVAQIGVIVALYAMLGIRDLRYRRIIKLERSSILLRGILIAGIAGLFFLSVNVLRSQFFDVQSVGEKVTFTASEGTSSIDERSAFWRHAWSISKQHLWLGTGPYSFRFVQPRLAEGVLATSDHAHNVILNTAMERGWPASILYVLIIAYVLWSSLRSLLAFRHEWSPERDTTTIMLLAVVAGVAAHNMIDYNLQFVGISLPVWLCLGFLVIPATSASESSFSRWKFSQYAFRTKIFLACVLLLTAFFEGGQLFFSSLGRHAEARGDSERALYWYGYCKYQLFSRDMHLSEAQLLLKNNEPRLALSKIETYMKENSVDPRVWKIKGMILLRSQDFAGAEKALTQSLEMGKYTDVEILDLLLQTSRDPDIKPRILSRKQEFDTLFSEYANAIEMNTHFIALSANVESLLSVSRQLSQLFPTDEKSYKLIARRAASHASKERSLYTYRAAGRLW